MKLLTQAALDQTVDRHARGAAWLWVPGVDFCFEWLGRDLTVDWPLRDVSDFESGGRFDFSSAVEVEGLLLGPAGCRQLGGCYGLGRRVWIATSNDSAAIGGGVLARHAGCHGYMIDTGGFGLEQEAGYPMDFHIRCLHRNAL
jgi:hypothetical protein